MKLALCNEVLRDLSFEAQCAFAAEVGYDGLELAPFTLIEDPTLLDSKAAARFRAALDAEGLGCAGLHWLLSKPDGLSITSADDAMRRRTVDLMRRLVDFAAEIGAKRLVHGSPPQRMLTEGDEEDSRARAIDCWVVAGDAAAAAGVLYCIEPLSQRETAFVNTVAEAVEIVREVDSPGLGTMVDASATARDGGDVVAVIDEWMPQGMIGHVHLNDPNRRGPGEGALRFAPVLSALKRHGYTGWASVEPFDYRPDGLACGARAVGYLRGLEETLT
jgi:sugar phosphate isomerase/epimerase